MHSGLHEEIDGLKNEVTKRKEMLEELRGELARVKFHGSGERKHSEEEQLEEMVTAART